MALNGRMNLVSLTQDNLLRLARNARVNDLLEYALMAAFLVVLAGAFLPGAASNVSGVFGSIVSTMSSATATS